MANVTRIDGPDYNGNYKAHLDDGSTMTFGRSQDPHWQDRDNPDRYWFVSIDSGRDHTTYIVEARPGILERNSEYHVRQVKAKGNDKKYWGLVAVALYSS